MKPMLIMKNNFASKFLSDYMVNYELNQLRSVFTFQEKPFNDLQAHIREV